MALGYLSALAGGCWLGTSVGVVSHRTKHLQWARLVGSIAYLGGDRFRWGVGQGWLRGDIGAVGGSSRFADRGAWTDDVLEFTRRLWREPGSPVSYASDFARIRSMWLVPCRPGPAPEIWVDGSGPAPRCRTATLGDLWFPDIRGWTPTSLVEARCRIASLRASCRSDEKETSSRTRVTLFAPVAVAISPASEPPWSLGRLKCGVLNRRTPVGVRRSRCGGGRARDRRRCREVTQDQGGDRVGGVMARPDSRDRYLVVTCRTRRVPVKSRGADGNTPAWGPRGMGLTAQSPGVWSAGGSGDATPDTTATDWRCGRDQRCHSSGVSRSGVRGTRRSEMHHEKAPNTSELP